MSWLKIDDRIPFHAKIVLAGNEGAGAWMRAAAWSAGEQQNGFFPDRIAHAIADESVWEDLIAARLVHGVEGGYEIHDFLDWNPSGQKVVLKRQARSEAGKRGGKKSGETRRAKQTTKQLLRSHEAKPEAKCEAKDQTKTNPDPDPDPEREETPKPPGVGISQIPESAPDYLPASDLRPDEFLKGVLDYQLRLAGHRQAVKKFAHRDISLLFKGWFPGQTTDEHVNTVTEWIRRWLADPSTNLEGVHTPEAVFARWCNVQEGLGLAKPVIPYHQPAEIPPELTQAERDAQREGLTNWDLEATFGEAS